MTAELMPLPGPRRFKVLGYCLALFTLEVGIFLLIFPWTDWWLLNDIQDLTPGLRDVWEEPYFRGALSGLGAVNIYLAILEFLHTLRSR